MSPRKKGKDIESEVEESEVDAEAEIVEVSVGAETEAMGDEMEVVAKVPEEAAEAEIFEVSAGGWAGEAASAGTEVVAEALEKATKVDTAAEEETPGAEAGTTAEGKEMDVKKVNLKTLARDLYQMGLDLGLGLTPDEAALLTSETKLPPFISEEGEKEFREGLVEAYQEMLDERLQGLKQKLGVG